MTWIPAHAETMRAPLLLAAFALLLAGSCSSHGVSLAVQGPATLHREPPGYESARVTRIIDGDTIEVVITGRRAGPGAGDVRQGQHHDVRLLGIDTPESVNPNTAVECFGEESSAALAAFLEGREVVLVDDVENTDQYDRLLRYVYLGHEMANARLVANGYAFAYTYPPNVRHSSLFVRLQREARRDERGLWSRAACNGET
jgi:micrococcal nuclease